MINIYAIKDNVAEVYTQPIFCGNDEDQKVNDEIALRMFHYQLMNDTSLLHMYPSDYDLYFIGKYDEKTADFVQPDHPRFIFNGKEYLKIFLSNMECEVEDNVEE